MMMITVQLAIIYTRFGWSYRSKVSIYSGVLWWWW